MGGLMVAKGGFRIGEVHAYLVVGESGDEGIAAYHTGTGWMPMICADKARIDSLRPMVEALARETGQAVRLVKFATRTDVETIGG
jgi:hypothetical protein